MAVDFGRDNDQPNDRYYSVAVDSGTDIGDPFSVVAMTRLSPGDAVGAGFGYLVSTKAAVPSVDGLHFYSGRDSQALNKWHGRWENVATTLYEVSDIDDGTWRVVAFSGSTANAHRLRVCDVGADTVNGSTNDPPFSSGGSPPFWYVGARGDRNTDRYYRGQCAWIFKADYDLTDSDIIALAGGASPAQYVSGWSIQLLLDMSSNANVVDLVGGRTVTQNGTGWADYPSPYSLTGKRSSGSGGPMGHRRRRGAIWKR